MLLSDGGILNNFPSNLIREKCEKLIGVYVSPLQDIEGKQLNSIKAVSTRAYELLSHSVENYKFKDCDWFISPKELSNYGMFESNKARMNEIISDPEHPLAAAAAQTPATVTTRYAIATTPLYLDAGAKTDEGTLMPSTQVEVLANDNGRTQVRIDGWQQDGVSEVFYAAPGKRILSVLVGEAARKALVTGKSETDSATNLTWHQVSLTAWVDQSQLIGDQGKLWQYASTLMSNNCTGCHGLTALDHFNANQWIGVIKGMESRTSLTPEQARMLTQYVQKHASDMSAAH